MNSNDAEAVYAYYCLHKLPIKPSEFFAMDEYERAFVIAAIDVKVEKEKQASEKVGGE